MYSVHVCGRCAEKHLISTLINSTIHLLSLIEATAGSVGLWHYTQDQIPSHKKVFFPIGRAMATFSYSTPALIFACI